MRKLSSRALKTPYGVPYEPSIWVLAGAYRILGTKQYFLYTYFPDIFTDDYMLSAINFVLGCHPGSNTASFASGWVQVDDHRLRF